MFACYAHSLYTVYSVIRIVYCYEPEMGHGGREGREGLMTLRDNLEVFEKVSTQD